MKKISFLASGRGSNFFAVAQAMQNGLIVAAPGLLITSNKEAGAIGLAQQIGFPVLPLSWKEENDRDGFEARAIDALDKAGTDLLVCAGYMKILSPAFVDHFKLRVINIHPSLLPSFPGIHSQKQALDYGVKVSGCTVHFVDSGVDTGPIILQRQVPVYTSDTEESLSNRILEQEHLALIEAVQLICDDRLSIRGRLVFIQA